MPEEKRIEKWRPNMLGTRYHVADQMFWNDGDTEPLEDDNSKTMRILVCGNAGAGKSTLVKRVFGIDPDDKEVVGLQRTFLLTHLRLTCAADGHFSS